MPIIGFCRKINSMQVKDIEKNNGLFFLHGVEVYYLEMCGVILDHTPMSITIVDYYGKTELFHRKLSIADYTGSCIFRIVPSLRQDRIVLICKEIIKASIYEEIAFNFEVKALEEIG